MSSSVFHRDLRAAYPSVVSAEGMYLRTESGQRILDAVGGAAAVVLGHGVREITAVRRSSRAARPGCCRTIHRRPAHSRMTPGRPSQAWNGQRVPAWPASGPMTSSTCGGGRPAPGAGAAPDFHHHGQSLTYNAPYRP